MLSLCKKEIGGLESLQKKGLPIYDKPGDACLATGIPYNYKRGNRDD